MDEQSDEVAGKRTVEALGDIMITVRGGITEPLRR